MSRRRYSLSIHITSLFLVLTTLVGAVLIGISYKHSQDLLTESAKELSSENGAKLETTFQNRAGPILTTLDFMSMSDVIESADAPVDQTRFIASLAIIFQRNPELVALYYASEQGDLNVLRPLRTNADRERFDAPDKATLMINSMAVSGKNDVHFLNGRHVLLQSIENNDNDFDPRVRPWFVNASSDGDIRLTEPYFFYFLKTSGVTLSRRSPDGQFVVGADFTLDSLSQQVSTMGYSEQTRLLLLDSQFNVLAHHQLEVTLPELSDSVTQSDINGVLEQSVFAPVLGRVSSQIIYEALESDGIDWSVTLTPVELNNQTRLLLAEAIPQHDILASLLSMRDRQVQVAIFMLIVSFVVIWLVSKRITNPLLTLVTLTSNIARFDFKKTRYPKSVIKEVSNLTKSIELMEHTLHDLLRLLRETASNRDFSLLAKTITHQSYMVTKAETIVLYTLDNKDASFSIAANHAIIPFKVDINEFLSNTPWMQKDLEKGEIIHLTRGDNAIAKYSESLFNTDIYFFPMHNKNKKLVGILLLGYERPITPEQSDKHAFLKELLSFAEIAKENITQMEQQKEMLNAFVALIASAIDTKSPYTGGHCQRIPTLANLLTKVADKDKRYFADFSMGKDQWEALNLAAWLHDCGKVTTPEYVVDKATKLETIYDRIHEVRMRFELLKVQAEVDCLQSILDGEEKEKAEHILAQRHQQLDDDFYFVAECNLGGESMTDEAIERLEQIAQIEWVRTLDDQAGTSWIERERAGDPTPLPIKEKLLADKPVHKVGWGIDVNPKDQWAQAFILDPGELKYNRGELFNLSIRRGTLNDEERFIINDHIIQTITMLNRLPYPEHLQQVPEIAGGHHERMDGKGYPLGLTGEQLSVPARVMAIADVFEALTSSDRPYKKGKTLDESINIMTSMATSGHIDPKLYLLFLEHQIDQEYASAYLHPSQISEFDREAHIQKVKAYIKASL
ncbi:HD domain-containing protein [Vibrio scophthalmi]|uniref:HD domain-containing phosphohydrolase n=1 Tax=Vibrio scophthalmi TaxID=45658 RepID=UPI002FF3AB49